MAMGIRHGYPVDLIPRLSARIWMTDCGGHGTGFLHESSRKHVRGEDEPRQDTSPTDGMNRGSSIACEHTRCHTL
jgi:hypothetical protein